MAKKLVLELNFAPINQVVKVVGYPTEVYTCRSTRIPIKEGGEGPYLAVRGPQPAGRGR